MMVGFDEISFWKGQFAGAFAVRFREGNIKVVLPGFLAHCQNLQSSLPVVKRIVYDDKKSTVGFQFSLAREACHKQKLN